MGSNLSRYETLKEIASSRKSTRSYSDRAVSDEDIRKILAIAETSPFASGKKRWDVLVIKDRETIKNIADATRMWIKEQAENVREDFREGFLQYTKNFTFFEQAPVLFIPVFRPSKSISVMLNERDEKIVEWERDAYTKSISSVVTHILLAAESLDIKTCYMTGPVIAEKKIMLFLNIKPGRSIGAIIPAGYTEETK